MAAKHRIRILADKQKNEVVRGRAEIAKLMGSRDFEKARIRVEALVTLERRLQAQEVLELMTDLLKARLDLIARDRKAVPPDVVESVHTIIYAAPRTGIDELKRVRMQLVSLYGEKVAAAERPGTEGCRVNAVVRANLSGDLPDPGSCIAALVKIAADKGIPFDPLTDLAISTIGMQAPPPAAIAAATSAASGSAGGTPRKPGSDGGGAAGGGGMPGGGGGEGQPVGLAEAIAAATAAGATPAQAAAAGAAAATAAAAAHAAAAAGSASPAPVSHWDVTTGKPIGGAAGYPPAYGPGYGPGGMPLPIPVGMPLAPGGGPGTGYPMPAYVDGVPPAGWMPAPAPAPAYPSYPPGAPLPGLSVAATPGYVLGGSGSIPGPSGAPYPPSDASVSPGDLPSPPSAAGTPLPAPPSTHPDEGYSAIVARFAALKAGGGPLGPPAAPPASGSDRGAGGSTGGDGPTEGSSTV